MTDHTEESWYIIKKASNQCDIVSADVLAAADQSSEDQGNEDQDKKSEGAIAPPSETWGPFKAKNQAIAKRIGLIRAGKCEPVR